MSVKKTDPVLTALRILTSKLNGSHVDRNVSFK